MSYDILIKNGTVIDGTGSSGFRAGIAIKNDRIIDISETLNEDAAHIIDAKGKCITPGFIDMHSHADFTLPISFPHSLCTQGVTTVVTGNCGESPAPLFPETRKNVIEHFNIPGKDHPWHLWHDFASFLDTLTRQGLPVNIVPLAGLGTIRAGIMGFDNRPPGPEEMGKMKTQVKQALSDGAAGVSSGLIYPPGSFSSTDELVELAATAAEAGGFYASHIRGEGKELIHAVAEAVEIGRKTGIPVQISHHKACWPANWGLQEQSLSIIETARQQGVDVSADVYPYIAASTTLLNNLPEWAQAGDTETILARLGDPGVRETMARDIQSGWNGSWDKVMVSRCTAFPEVEGQYISELAENDSKTPENWVFDALKEARLNISVILFLASEENLEKVLIRPWVSIGSDAYSFPQTFRPEHGIPHPRTGGTFPRVLGRYVREKKILGLETAVHKMTGLPAQRLNLKDRGILAGGYRADIVVFDPETIMDRATFENPFQPPDGISEVICNGCFIKKQGRVKHATPGRILTR